MRLESYVNGEATGLEHVGASGKMIEVNNMTKAAFTWTRFQNDSFRLSTWQSAFSRRSKAYRF